MKKIGFIGAGNMASAIAGGIISSGIETANNILIFDKNELQYSKFDANCIKMGSIKELVLNSDYIFFSIKPQNIKDVLNEIKNTSIVGKVFVSICAGITIKSIESTLNNAKIVRTMPNTPLMIGEGVTALCRNQLVTDDEFSYVTSLFSSSGFTEELLEEDIDKITAITSSSPAYVYLFAKAMRDGAIKMGFNNDNTLEMICRTIIGSAKMILASDKSVDELITMVKSPNGTTERALNVFESSSFEETIAEAMDACAKRANELAKMN